MDCQDQTKAGFSLDSHNMDSNPHETRPLKRRRIEMAPPDGFALTRASKPIYKTVVPQFSSGFNKDFDPASSKESTDNLKERRLSTVEGLDTLKERSSFQVLHALVPSRPTESDVRHYTSRTLKDRPSAFLPSLHGSLVSSQLKIDTPILQLRPPPKPPISLYPTLNTASAPLKPAVPPLPLLANKYSAKDLKSLQPPPVPLPSNPAIGAKNLRTISKTRVALATDLSTNSGVLELASIFLHDQHPDITLPESHPDIHDGRGLGLSPEKKGKSKSFKFVRYVLLSYCLEKNYIMHVFIRGGLATRASIFLERSQTSLVLWQKETERRANTLSYSDLRVTIIKILHKPIPSHTASKQPISLGIALCRIREADSMTSPGSYNFDDLYRIVLSFSSCLSNSLFNDPYQFSESRTVHICFPWQEISFAEGPSTTILPASLPLPSFEPTVNDKVLLCSRFLIL